MSDSRQDTSARIPLRQTIDGCLAVAIGSHGIGTTGLALTLGRLIGPLADLVADYEQRRLPLLRIAEAEADIVAAEAALAGLSEGARTIVFFGTGGSSLGGQTLAQFGGWNIPGQMDAGQRGRPRTRFYDNLDPATLAAALGSLDLATTRFVITSKSGNTVETLVQAIAALDAVKRNGHAGDIPRRFLGITEPAAAGVKNGLHDLLAAHAVPMLPHEPGLGGRFSVLSNVGLLPALARGLDVRAMRAGARRVIEAMRHAGAPAAFAPAAGAAVAVALLEQKGVGTHVMMPYADQLGRFSHWFVQLWAESLGKAGKGTSPIACLGPLDQHSQLQLFMDGPRHHLVTMLRVPTAGTGSLIDGDLARTAGIGFLAGRAAGDLVAAEAAATADALVSAGRPVRVIDIDRLDAYAMGALVMHFMLETILVARLLGIDPFDQPAVELAKRLARKRIETGA